MAQDFDEMRRASRQWLKSIFWVFGVMALFYFAMRPGYLVGEDVVPTLIDGANGYQKLCHYLAPDFDPNRRAGTATLSYDEAKASVCPPHLR